ncbi:MAG: cation:proton antiporter [Gemmatimonadota bacterium]
MSQIALFLGGAVVAHGIARRWGLPATPLLLLAGFVMARAGLLPPDLLQDALVLGLTFLLFVVGVELTPRRVRAQRTAALRVGFLQFTTLGLLGTLTSLALGFDGLTALYTGLALTASSTLVIIPLLQQRRQLFEPYGRLVTGVLLVQDVLIILLMPLLIRLPGGWPAVLASLAGTTALLALAFLAQRSLAPRLARLHADEELLLLGGLAVLFAFVGMAHALALPVAAGAFLAGVALSPFPVSGLLRGPLTPVVVFFTAIFFLALGGLLTVPGPRELVHALVLVLVVLVVTPVVVTAVAERSGFTARPALEAGLLLSQTSELSLVVALHALLLGHISPDSFSVLALATVATMVLTPYLTGEARLNALLRLHPLAGKDMEEGTQSNHIVLLGCGSGGLPLLETLLAAGEEVVVIDDDPEIITRLRQGGVACVHGTASDPQVLRVARVEKAMLVGSTIRRPRDNQILLESAPQVTVLVRVFDEEDALWVEERGGIPVLYSAAAADEFNQWFKATFAGPGDTGNRPGAAPDTRAQHPEERPRSDPGE